MPLCPRGRVPHIWQCGSMALLPYGSMALGQYGTMGMVEYGNMARHMACTIAVWHYCNVAAAPGVGCHYDTHMALCLPPLQ